MIEQGKMIECAFLCIVQHFVLNWITLTLKKAEAEMQVSRNAKHFTSVFLQHKSVFALWQAGIVVDGHSANANNI